MYDVKCVSQPDTIALLGNNYSLQIKETGFAEQFYASHRMGPATICLKISARIAERETYRMIPLKTCLFSHWSIPLSLGPHPYAGRKRDVLHTKCCLGNMLISKQYMSRQSALVSV